MSADAGKLPSRGHGPIGGWPQVLWRQDVFLALIGLVVVAAIVSPTFLSVQNIGNLLTQSALLGLLAIAQFLVVVSGGFDLSVAAVMALSSVVFAASIPLGVAPAAVLAVMTGGACGLFSGVAVAFGRVQSLIATLAMMGIARGLALSISERSILVSDSTVTTLRGFSIGFLSVPTLIWLLVSALAILWFAMSRSAVHVYAVGGNANTARLAGVAVNRVRLGVFTTSGLLAGLTGVVLVIRSSSGVPLGGMGWELDTIAAIVIGGTNLFGGEGSLVRAMAGVVIYQLIANIMNLSGLDPYYQDIVRAVVIVAAVGISIWRSRHAGRRVLQGRG